jgi:hypothetical protein
MFFFGPPKLDRIGRKHGTDKAGRHGYTKTYEQLFKKLRNNKIKLLEIGAGYTGASHKMWKDYFPNGEIYCMDLFHLEEQSKTLQKEMQDYGIYTYKGNQLSRPDLHGLVKSFGKDFDIIVDDGAHLWDAIQLSLSILFPVLKMGGFYIVEDCRTADRRNKILGQVNANLAARGIAERSIDEFSLKESLESFENNGVWKSNILVGKEKDYLIDNISSWEFLHRRQLCTINK